MPVLIEMTNLIILVIGRGQEAGHGLVAVLEEGHGIDQGLGQEAVLGGDLGIEGGHATDPVRDLAAAHVGVQGGDQEIEEGHEVVRGEDQGIAPGVGQEVDRETARRQGREIVPGVGLKTAPGKDQETALGKGRETGLEDTRGGGRGTALRKSQKTDQKILGNDLETVPRGGQGIIHVTSTGQIGIVLRKSLAVLTKTNLIAAVQTKANPTARNLIAIDQTETGQRRIKQTMISRTEAEWTGTNLKKTKVTGVDQIRVSMTRTKLKGIASLTGMANLIGTKNVLKRLRKEKQSVTVLKIGLISRKTTVPNETKHQTVTSPTKWMVKS